MGATAAVHPTDETLRAYGLGKLDDASFEPVSTDLDSCPDCQRRVAELSSDSFLGRLRRAQGSPEMSAANRSQVDGQRTETGPAVAVSPPPADTLPSELVDHPDYEIVRELGRGGMGVVYLARNKLMGRLEVLKVVGGHLVERPGVRERFLREVQSAAKLQHKNIVAAYSAMRLGEGIVLTMEYVPGEDLAQMVKSRGPLPVVHACYFIWDLYQAHFSMEARPLNLVRPEVPVELAAVVAKMMAKEPRRRFQAPGEVAQALTPFFKPDRVAVQGANPEISPVAQPEATLSMPGAVSAPPRPAMERTPAPVSEARTPAPTQPESILEGLIDFGETDPLFDTNLDTPRPLATRETSRRSLRPSSHAAEKLSRFGPSAWWTAAGTLLLGLAVAWGVILLKLAVRYEPPAQARPPGNSAAGAPEPGSKGKARPREFKTQPGSGRSLTAYRRTGPRTDAKWPGPGASEPVNQHPAIDRSRFTRLSGQWRVEAGELIPTDATRSNGELLFGDNDWTDYDFTVDAMRGGGGNSFSLFFRSTDRNNEYDYTVSGDDGKSCSVANREQGHAYRIDRYEFRILDRLWYTARVQIRGDRFVCSLYDYASGREIRLFDFIDDRHRQGRVGLQTFGSSVRFKNIKVTDPDGKVLWEGPPAIESTKPAEWPKPKEFTPASPAAHAKRQQAIPKKGKAAARASDGFQSRAGYPRRFSPG